jgi:hypothetical protein
MPLPGVWGELPRMHLPRLSDKGRRGPQHSPTDRSRNPLCSEIRPNSRSKRPSNPFSDGLSRHFGE